MPFRTAGAPIGGSKDFNFRGINGAVMGAVAGAPLMARYLEAMVAEPADQWAVPCALGPDLLESLVARHGGGDLTIHPPPVFYPLSPEISEHWFRRSNRVRLDEALRPETRVAHWYASVRTRARVAAITPAYVRANRGRQLYSALVARVLAGLS